MQEYIVYFYRLYYETMSDNRRSNIRLHLRLNVYVRLHARVIFKKPVGYVKICVRLHVTLDVRGYVRITFGIYVRMYGMSEDIS